MIITFKHVSTTSNSTFPAATCHSIPKILQHHTMSQSAMTSARLSNHWCTPN